MTTKLLGILRSIECDEVNVANVCEEYLSDYNYSYGSSKIVVFEDNWVYKKIFGNAPQDECEIYKKAIAAGLGDFFAASMMKFEDIYIQETIEMPLDRYIREAAKVRGKFPYGEMRESYRKMGLEQLLYRSDCVVIYYLLAQHGIEEILKFQDFVVENDMTDLNFYNAGFRNGRIVFFDYSGIDMELME